MEKLKVMLCCGAGMSSGFLAQRIRSEAKKQKLDIQVDARSENQVSQYFGKFNILLIGPHYASQLENYQKLTEEYGFKVAVIPNKIYGTLDAKAMLELIKSMV